MGRAYHTTPTKVPDRFSQKGYVEPDARLVQVFHHFLDLVENEQLALAIDRIVVDLLRCNYPRPVPMDESQVISDTFMTQKQQSALQEMALHTLICDDPNHGHGVIKVSWNELSKDLTKETN